MGAGLAWQLRGGQAATGCSPAELELLWVVILCGSG